MIMVHQKREIIFVLIINHLSFFAIEKVKYCNTNIMKFLIDSTKNYYAFGCTNIVFTDCTYDWMYGKASFL